MSKNPLKDKVIVITGSGRGIGKALAENAGKQGAKVILNGRTKATLENTVFLMREKGFECQYIQADVSDVDESRRFIEQAVKCYGRIDILVNNAGIASRGLFEETKAETWSEVLKVNTLGYIYPSIEALPHLRNSKGSLIFISSIAGRAGIPGHAVYSVSKMALTALAEALDVELSVQGIHVGIVYVGFTRNDPEKRILNGDGTMKEMGKRPASLQMEPEKVASAIARLIIRRRRSKVLSFPGHLQSFFFMFPVIRKLFLKNTLRQYSGLYQDQKDIAENL